MNESSVEKRKFLYNYIHRLDGNIHSNFDDHTKLNTTIGTITIKDFDVLIELAKLPTDISYIIGGAIGKAEILPLMKDPLHQSIPLYFTGYNQRSLTNLLVRLGNLDLIYIEFGKSEGTLFGPITEFGRIFLDLVSE